MVASVAMPQEPEQQPSFEGELEKLEGIVSQLEDGKLSLEESLQLFEQGVKLSRACRKQLREAETKVEILLRKGGEMQPEPFELNEEPAAATDSEDESPF